MSLLFETIRIQDGVIYNLLHHNQRMYQSRKLLLGLTDFIDLINYIKIPVTFSKGKFKCKVVYQTEIEHISFEPYLPRTINSLRLVDDNSICYKHKFSDRKQLDELSIKRGNYDEILIVKNGLITDTSFSNIVFYDGFHWVTPVNPLLHGTMRSYLLSNGKISEKEIPGNELRHYQKARLINAMLPLDSGLDIELERIGYF
jgi:4-amino-4-deoxychorismate lyase